MGLRVDQLSLGPMGTNCYVVRRELGSPEAAVVDPSGSATELRLTLARLGTRCTGILVTHGHWDHLLGVADLAEGAGAPVHMPEGERALLESPQPAFAPAGVTVRAHAPEILVAGGETVEVAGIAFEVLAVPGHSPAHVAYHAEGCLFSGDVLFAGSVGRTDHPGRELGDAARVDPLARRRRSRRTRSSIPATVRRRPSARSWRGTRSSPTSGGSRREQGDADRAPARHARRDAGRAARLAAAGVRVRATSALSTATGGSTRLSSRTPRSSCGRLARARTSCTRRCTRSRTAATAPSRCVPRRLPRSSAPTSSTDSTASRSP